MISQKNLRDLSPRLAALRTHPLAAVCSHLAILQRHLADLSPLEHDIGSCAKVLAGELDVLRRYCETNGIDWRAAQSEVKFDDGGKFQPEGTG